MTSSDESGQHRREKRVRGVSKGPIIAVVAVVVVVLLAFGWFKVRDAADDRGSDAAATCVEGDSVLTVTADPSVAPQVRTIAQRYNDTAPVVRDHCATVQVEAKASQLVQEALTTGNWDEGTLGARPGLWLAQTAGSLPTLAGTIVDGTPKPLASSPVRLAVPQQLADALQSGNVGWGDLPRLQSDQNALSAYGLAGWGGLRLTLPTGPGSEATDIGTEAVAAAVANAGFGPLSDEAVRSAPVVTAVSTLAAGGPKTDSTKAALDSLTAQPDPATGEIHAVFATEQQLKAASGGKVTGYTPTGATVVSEVLAVPLSGTWVDETQHRTADLFVDFASQPDQRDILADSGFRVGEVERSLNPAPDSVRRQLADIVANPILGTNSTVLLDVSSSMGSDDKLAGATSALRNYVATAPETAAVGLWSYSKDLDGTKPYRVEVRTEPLAAERKRVLDDSLGGLRTAASARDQAYPTLIDAYSAALAGFVPGRTNSILLITDGPDDDSSVTGQRLLETLGAATDPGKPIRIDVIAIGQPSSSNTLPDLTQRTGGSFVRVNSANDPELAGAIQRLLG
ncbi:substrate-binding domain-containing protein [Antrihabitans sp. YC2-6]|uniref:substrate-binding domain-containing protein n=1 Tax=Antrihabitans sp. YC2-6 TaxID=2799498 RepID=UPI0018F2F500|nr:substrate-binding domain-containing protein [Antrihabitans sp. YC2-6]MBJ8348508.1 substrate-binding domain-containing protein [Antrihabitans sp. YC2-6]